MNEISAVIITYNEEKNIERCLKSLIGVVDEIIVLDSFSTDRTEQFCRKQDVIFEQHSFDGHIEQKNRVVKMASNNFVLSLDADEFLSDELKKSILEVKEDLSFDAYYFNRLNYYCGKPIKFGAWYPDRKIRLWNRNKGNWGGKNPHDLVILKTGVKKLFLKGDLNHFSYSSIEEHISQTNKFSTISAKVLFEEGRKISLFMIFLKSTNTFIKDFVFKFAFLSGFYGITIACVNSFATFLKYSKLRRLIKEQK